VIRKALLAACALALLAGCSSGRSFTDVVGNLRVTGDVHEGLLARDRGTLNVHLYDASTGYPVDANDVQVKAGRMASVHASRRQLGVYSADIANRRHIDLLITTRDNRSVFIALQQQ
jgi:hypothetical protein